MFEVISIIEARMERYIDCLEIKLRMVAFGGEVFERTHK